MKDLLNWSLEATFILSVLFLVYFLCFRNNTSVKLRRALLLLILPISILSPLANIELENGPDIQYELFDLDEQIISSVNQTLNISQQLPNLNEIATIPIQEGSIDYKPFIYGTGALLFGLILVIQIARLFFIITTGKWSRSIKLLVVRHKKIKAPSSFLFAIMLPAKTQLSEYERAIIIEHERQHLVQGHSLDLLAISILQAFMWFNPLLFWIRTEFKNLHEVLADKATLEKVNYKDYFGVLLATTFTINSFNLSHCFGQKKGLLNRIKLIKKQQTTMKRTVISLMAFSIIALCTIGINILSAQENKAKSPVKKNFKELTAEEIEKMAPRERSEYILNIRAKEEGWPEVSSREEALERIQRDKSYRFSTPFFLHGKLTTRFNHILSRLRDVYPDSDISYRYLDNPTELDYSGSNFQTSSPLYLGELQAEDKDELIELTLKDSATAMRFISRTQPVYHFAVHELGEEFHNTIRHDANYIMFYEILDRERTKIYNAKDVDILPVPVGGIEAFQRAVALDITLPENIIIEDLPESIEFSVVVDGGKQINSVNLLTKIEGKDKKNDNLYLLYGEILRQIQNKTRSVYSWKSGIKDGKEVRVRMKISIPTKYMM